MPDTGHISGLFLAHDQPGTGVGQNWASSWSHIGPILCQIWPSICPGLEWSEIGSILGQFWADFGIHLVPYLVSCYGEERVLYETYLDMDSWELPSTRGGGSSISMEKDPLGFGMGLKGCCLYHKKIPADRLRPLYSYIG